MIGFPLLINFHSGSLQDTRPFGKVLGMFSAHPVQQDVQPRVVQSAKAPLVSNAGGGGLAAIIDFVVSNVLHIDPFFFLND